MAASILNRPFFNAPGLRGLAVTLACAGLALMATGAARAAEPLTGSGQLLDRIVAVVNDGVVLESEVMQQGAAIVSRLRADGVQLPPAEVLQRQIVERLVVEKIQLQRAERLGITITDDQLNNALGTVARRNNITLAQLPDALAEQGIDYAAYRADIRKEMAIDQLRNRDLVPRISITRDEVEAYLANKGEDQNEYDISHILIAVPPGATKEDRDQAEALANDIYNRASGGEDFAQLAVAYSNGQQALEGGKIGWRKAEQLPTLFSDSVVEMDPGTVSRPISSSSGFHLVRLDQTRGREPVMVEQRLARHILISPDELKTDNDARSECADLARRISEGEDFAELAREFSDDKGTANAGGDLGWMRRGMFVPQFEAALDDLEPGGMSEPVRSPFGWHLIELIDEREIDNSEEQSMIQASDEIRNRKLQQETERWLMQLRDEAFVDYRS
ncbi:MAG: peptidylprolyl isomerase [Pseudomonadota bacterium]